MKRNTDYELPEAFIDHANDVAERLWPGGTVRPGENVALYASTALRTYYGRCYYRRNRDTGYANDEPTDLPVDTGEKYAIVRIRKGHVESSPERAKETLRHELIHAWQWIHPDGDTGHGPSFKQWTSDADVDY